MTNIRRDLSIEDGYAVWAPSYDTGFNPLIELERDCLKTFELPAHPSRVLDLATGTGRHALAYANSGSTVVALDGSAAMLSIAEENRRRLGLGSVTFSLAAIDEDLSIEPSSFDLAICALALCHISDIRRVVRNVARALQPNGMLVISDLHPEAVRAGLGTFFTSNDVQYAIQTVQHNVEDYSNALHCEGFSIVAIQERTLGDAVTKEPGSLAGRVAAGDWRRLPFCLAIAACLGRHSSTLVDRDGRS